MVPLKDIQISARIEASVATIDAQMTYTNPTKGESPVECSFEFPIDKSTFVSKLVCQIDDKIVEAQIKEKTKAKEQYSDAIASGNTAVFAEQKLDAESVTLLIGNLMPG
jgi:Ca-activated chloride channel family protein